MCKGYFVFVQLSLKVLAEILADENIHVTRMVVVPLHVQDHCPRAYYV